jgi:hypothetical protein
MDHPLKNTTTVNTDTFLDFTHGSILKLKDNILEAGSAPILR